MAAGVGALLLSCFPDTSPALLADSLKATAINIGAPGWDPETGHGAISAIAAYNLLAGAS